MTNAFEDVPPARRAQRTAFPVPIPRSALIGRHHDPATLRQLLRRDDVRLLTLSGAGGCGKTRLAIEAALDATDAFPGGVSFVGLAGVKDHAGVGSTLADVLGFEGTDDRPMADVLSAHARLTLHRRTLLVLDNLEHLLSAADLIVALLDSTPHLHVLATSRTVLRLYGEHDYRVSPLALPDPARPSTLDALRDVPAIALFLVRAKAADHDFSFTAANASAIAEICCRLDGLPLGIELAAAHITTLPPLVMLARLRNRLDLPQSGYRDVPSRQQTLRNALDWSYDLLAPAEQRLFRRISVFAGGCTLEGVEAVCNAAHDLGVDAMVGVSSLIARSQLRELRQRGEPRFTSLETIREYGLELLAGSGEEAVVRRAHAAYCLVLAEEGHAAITDEERSGWLELCTLERENFRAALAFLIAGDHAEWAQRLGVALHALWDRPDHLSEGRAQLAAILRLGNPQARQSRTWVNAAVYAAGLAAVQGDFESTRALHHAALEVSRVLDDPKGVINGLTGLGFAERGLGNHVAARSWFEQALAASRHMDDAWRIAAALSNLARVLADLEQRSAAAAVLHEAARTFARIDDSNGAGWAFHQLGEIAHHAGDLEEAKEAYERGLALFQRLGHEWGIARCCLDLGYLACEQADRAAASAAFAEALRLLHALQHRRGIIQALEGCALLSVLEDDPVRAVTMAGATAAMRRASNLPSVKTRISKLRDDAVSRAWTRIDERAARCAWDAGALLSLEALVALALDGRRVPGPPPTENSSDRAGVLPPSHDQPGSRHVGRAPAPVTHPVRSRCSRSCRR
nr:tetratricopeptide repeat protein [Luteitalea pratensis]